MPLVLGSKTYVSVKGSGETKMSQVNNPTDISELEADVTDIHDAISHVSAIFPSDTNLTCTFTAHADANTWSAWAEIQDSGATKLSDFCVTPMHLTSIVVETISDDSVLYMFEISWGAAYTPLTSGRFAGVGKFQAAHIQDRFWALSVPAGQLIYYRMKTETAVADTCTIHLRYHCH